MNLMEIYDCDGETLLVTLYTIYMLDMPSMSLLMSFRVVANLFLSCFATDHVWQPCVNAGTMQDFKIFNLFFSDRVLFLKSILSAFFNLLLFGGFVLLPFYFRKILFGQGVMFR